MVWGEVADGEDPVKRPANTVEIGLASDMSLPLGLIDAEGGYNRLSDGSRRTVGSRVEGHVQVVAGSWRM